MTLIFALVTVIIIACF